MDDEAWSEKLELREEYVEEERGTSSTRRVNLSGRNR
jgi:hypothetical protein